MSTRHLTFTKDKWDDSVLAILPGTEGRGAFYCCANGFNHAMNIRLTLPWTHATICLSSRAMDRGIEFEFFCSATDRMGIVHPGGNTISYFEDAEVCDFFCEWLGVRPGDRSVSFWASVDHLHIDGDSNPFVRYDPKLHGCPTRDDPDATCAAKAGIG